ncbi:MAG: 50S ribosomal protein L6 [Piptocephalis tieghemiana]|nr:MAG: 50S ribosomal protein L6 [Piptocephalis tieghemiana]
MNRRQALVLSRSFWTTTALRSNVGSTPLVRPAEVEIREVREQGREGGEVGRLEVVGPNGQVDVPLWPFVSLYRTELSGGRDTIQVGVKDAKERHQRAMWGTTRSLLANAVTGVTEGYSVPVRFVGVGYRAALEEEGRQVSLRLGFSGPLLEKVPEGLTVRLVNPTRLVISGANLQQVKEFAARIRKHRPPEPYNQKGVFVGDETIKKKEGKKK